LILSGWVTHYGFDRSVRKALEKAINRNAKVHIGWGYKSKLKASQNRSEFTDAERDLVKFAKKHHNSVCLVHFENHSKLLIADSTCIIGSFNWLSNAFSKNDELSAIIEDNDFVGELWASVSQELEDKRGLWEE
jgi:phosphatidylserine/phosphatidylglycerophosphate/cardiolipin synthase-like enzyme